MPPSAVRFLIEAQTHAAYEVLARRKKAGESFSEVIKAHFGRRKTAAEFMRLASKIRLSEKTLDAVTQQVRARRKSA